MKIKLPILLVLFLLVWHSIQAQTRIDFHGKITCKKTSEPISFGAVNLKEAGIWTTADKDGNFKFLNITPGNYTIEVACLGYDVHSIPVTIGPETNEIQIKLIPHSFDMEEVNILAKKKTDLGTTTNIGRAAIEHVQPTSLGDIMQLLPGNIAQNPDLSGPQQISIREIGTDNNSANGTAIIVDGTPISNDANLQTFSTSNPESNQFNTVVGGGIDLRSISTDNIESIEVIKGIPSVVYGNLTSGAVVVKTKAGTTPLEIKLKADPNIKQIAMNKGMKIGNKNNFINFDLDYIQSYSDLTSKYKGFNRVTGDLAYSGVFMKDAGIPLSVNAKISYFGTLDNEKTDPDAFVANEEFSSKENGTRLSFYGQWALKKKLVTNLNYNLSASYTHQESYEKRYRTTGGNLESISLAFEEGENTGIFLPVEQLTELTIDGKPLSLFAQFTADKNNLFSNGMINKFIYGFDYTRNENLGEGQIYDLNNPPNVSSSSTRPRAFSDIPAMQSYAIYLEEKLKIPVGTTSFTIQAGARLNNFQATGLTKGNPGLFLEPRLNVQYDLLNKKNNQLFEQFAISFGIGKTYKSPSLYNLYPDKSYYDLSVLNHPQSKTAIFYTYIMDGTNPDLLPSENTKKEVSLDFKIKNISGNLTGFYENLENGFDFVSGYRYIDYYMYDASGVPEGTTPDPATLPKIDAEYIISYQTPINNQKSKKLGVEYSIDLGKIKKLYTSFNVDGAWLKTERIYSTSDYEYLASSGTGIQFDKIGIFPSGESKISERFNSNLRMVTHIPGLRMIVTSSMQMIWYDQYYYPEYNEQPIYLVDKSGNHIPFDEEFLNLNPNYRKFITVKAETYYLKERMTPLWVANLKFSKEITDKMKLSLYVNNFLNYRPLYLYTRSQSYIRRNQSIYFGAEINIRL